MSVVRYLRSIPHLHDEANIKQSMQAGLDECLQTRSKHDANLEHTFASCLLHHVNGVLLSAFHDLWGVYTIQQTSSKLPANVFKIHALMLDVCWTFAGSCKHSISKTFVHYF